MRQLDAVLGLLARIVMNPPFERGSDLDDIKHAFALLARRATGRGLRQRPAPARGVGRGLLTVERSARRVVQGAGMNVNTAIVVLDT
jgi:hypothetical protein